MPQKSMLKARLSGGPASFQSLPWGDFGALTWALMISQWSWSRSRTHVSEIRLGASNMHVLFGCIRDESETS